MLKMFSLLIPSLVLLNGSNLYSNSDYENEEYASACNCMYGGECTCGESCNCGQCSCENPCDCMQGGECTCGESCECRQEEDYACKEPCDCMNGGECTCGDSCNCDCEEDNEDDEPPPVRYQPGIDCAMAERCGRSGVWLPEDPPLYRPMIADPRQICYSAGWRFNDQVLVKNIIDVSFGDYFPIYRWCHVGPWDGELQIDIEGAVWAVFDPLHESSPLVNADYYGGVPITYAFGDWEFRLRLFHISSHIGDEFLIDHPDFDRRNASFEFVDFFVSNDITDEIRLYGGVGYIVGMDREFKCSRFYAEAGTEVRFSGLGFYEKCQNLYGEPFLAMHFRWKRDFRHHLDQTYALGYEIGKTDGLHRKLRFLLEYHDGYSLEGQFCKLPTNYLSVRAQYGY